MADKSVFAIVQESRAAASAAIVCLVVAREFECDADDILRARHTSRWRDAQKMAIYIVVNELRNSRAAVAYAFGCSKSKVISACNDVEERRERSDYDETVDRLVNQVCPAMGGRPPVIKRGLRE